MASPDLNRPDIPFVAVDREEKPLTIGDPIRPRARLARVPLTHERHWRLARHGSYHKAWHSACRRAAVLKDTEGNPVKRNGKAVFFRPQLLGRIPHDFRRSACRRLIQNGIPEQIAMRLTGWRSRAMLDRYFVTNERDLADAVSKVAALRAAPAKPNVVPLLAEA